MAFLLEATSDEGLICGYCVGLVNEIQVIDAIDKAVASGLTSRGQDRIVIALPEARLPNLDLRALRRIKSRVQNLESNEELGPRARTALVWSEPSHSGVLALYKALWSEPACDDTRMAVFPNVRQALNWLGRSESLRLPPARVYQPVAGVRLSTAFTD